MRRKILAWKPTSVPSGVGLDVIRLAGSWDVSAEEWLEGLDIRSETLADAVACVPLPRYLALVERARALTGEPGLGFCLGLQRRSFLQTSRET